jgi:hypothetical protein
MNILLFYASIHSSVPSFRPTSGSDGSTFVPNYCLPVGKPSTCPDMCSRLPIRTVKVTIKIGRHNDVPIRYRKNDNNNDGRHENYDE